MKMSSIAYILRSVDLKKNNNQRSSS